MFKQKFVFVLGNPRIKAIESTYGYWNGVFADGLYIPGCGVAEMLCGRRTHDEINESIVDAPKGVYTAILPLEV